MKLKLWIGLARHYADDAVVLAGLLLLAYGLSLIHGALGPIALGAGLIVTVALGRR